MDEPSLSIDNLPTGIQTLRQRIRKHLSTEQSQKSYTPKFTYVFTDEILAQTNLALETIPKINITEPNALTYALVKTLQESVRKTESLPSIPHNA